MQHSPEVLLMDDLVMINSRRLALNPMAFSPSKNAGLSSLPCSVDKSPGPADILVNTIPTAILLVRLDLLPFGKSPSTAISMFHSEEMRRTATIASFSDPKYLSKSGTVVGTFENIKRTV